jgi:hypothetical protein
VSVDSSGEQLLAANPARRHGHIGNTSSSVDVFLSFGSADAAGQGIYLKAGTVYEISGRNLTHLAVFGITASGTATVSVEEGS